MSESRITPEQIERTKQFHGHWCPGLAIGVRASEIALREVGRDGDEQIVAVVEADMCAADAIQFLTGCTFGKGNLRYKDYGKVAFTFYRRSDGKALRLLFKQPMGQDEAWKEFRGLQKKMLAGELTAQEEKRLQELKMDRSSSIMAADLDSLFEVKDARAPQPRKAMILESLTCEECGEPTMESRTRRLAGKVLCIPCFEAKDNWQ